MLWFNYLIFVLELYPDPTHWKRVSNWNRMLAYCHAKPGSQQPESGSDRLRYIDKQGKTVHRNKVLTNQTNKFTLEKWAERKIKINFAL